MRDRPTGQLSTCANGNVTCGSPATPAMLMRQSVGRKKLARSDSTFQCGGAMSAVVGMQIQAVFADAVSDQCTKRRTM
jgi:hypothetical protein